MAKNANTIDLQRWWVCKRRGIRSKHSMASTKKTIRFLSRNNGKNNPRFKRVISTSNCGIFDDNSYFNDIKIWAQPSMYKYYA